MPAGVDTGSTLRLTGRGAVGPRGGGAGDLYVHLRVAAHERFRREGDDLVTDLPVSIAQAALGTKFMLPTLDGDEEIVVPAGTQPGASSCCASAACPGCRAAGAATCACASRCRCPPSSPTSRPSCCRSSPRRRGEDVHAEHGLFARIKSAFQ